MTDQDIKDKLFELWAGRCLKDKIGRKLGSNLLKITYSEKTIREIKASMKKDGVPVQEINKIIMI